MWPQPRPMVTIGSTGWRDCETITADDALRSGQPRRCRQGANTQHEGKRKMLEPRRGNQAALALDAAMRLMVFGAARSSRAR
jgi:hypothetical protein